MSYVTIHLLTEQRNEKVLIRPTRRTHLLHRGLMGLQVPGKEAITPSSPYGTHRRTNAMRVPAAFASRLYTFFERHTARYVKGYDCNSFARFMMGWDSESRSRPTAFYGSVVRINDIQSFEPYVLASNNRNAPPMHAVIGLKDGLSISVFGIDSVIMIARNVDLFEVYAADRWIHATSCMCE